MMVAMPLLKVPSTRTMIQHYIISCIHKKRMHWNGKKWGGVEWGCSSRKLSQLGQIHSAVLKRIPVSLYVSLELLISVKVLKLVFFWSVSKYSNPSFVSKVNWIKHLQFWEQLWDHLNHQKSSEPTSVCLCRVFPIVLMLPFPKLRTTFWLQDKISISALLHQPHTVCVYCKWLVNKLY